MLLKIARALARSARAAGREEITDLDIAAAVTVLGRALTEAEAGVFVDAWRDALEHLGPAAL